MCVCVSQFVYEYEDLCVFLLLNLFVTSKKKKKKKISKGLLHYHIELVIFQVVWARFQSILNGALNQCDITD